MPFKLSRDMTIRYRNGVSLNYFHRYSTDVKFLHGSLIRVSEVLSLPRFESF